MADENTFTPLTEQDKEFLKNKSAYSLPNNPSDKQLSPNQIKAKLYEPSLIIFDWLQRAISEMEISGGDVSEAIAKIIDGRTIVGKAYHDANNNLIDTYYLPKIVSTTTNKQTYIKNADGTQTMVDVADSVVNEAVVQRTNNGNIKVNTTGQANDEAVSFTQMDAVQTDLNTEKTNRATGDTNLGTRIGTEEIRAAAAEDALSQRITDVEASQNLADIVADLTALMALDVSKLKEESATVIGDKVEVLSDSTHSNISTIYKLINKAGTTVLTRWAFVGNYNVDAYTKGQSDTYFLKRDGGVATGNISMGNFQLTSVGNATLDTDATPYGQMKTYVKDNVPTFYESASTIYDWFIKEDSADLVLVLNKRV